MGWRHMRVWRGAARRGEARLGLARLGRAWAVNSGKGSVSNGGFIEADSFIWFGAARYGKARFGGFWPGTERQGMG